MRSVHRRQLRHRLPENWRSQGQGRERAEAARRAFRDPQANQRNLIVGARQTARRHIRVAPRRQRGIRQHNSAMFCPLRARSHRVCSSSDAIVATSRRHLSTRAAASQLFAASGRHAWQSSAGSLAAPRAGPILASPSNENPSGAHSGQQLFDHAPVARPEQAQMHQRGPKLIDMPPVLPACRQRIMAF